jgi:deoxycytidine triphosphate deaminase
MAYSGEDLFQNYRKTFVISPFDDTQVSPVGYDLRVGSAFVLKQPSEGRGKFGLLATMRTKSPSGAIGVSPATEARPQQHGSVIVPGNTSVLIVTVEHVHLGPKVMGNVHARAGVSAMGMFLNPLTVDPNFGSQMGDAGRLILHLYNASQREIEIEERQAIATLVMHEVTTETHVRPRKAGFSGVLDAYKEFCESVVVHAMKRYVDERDTLGRGRREFDDYKESLRRRGA